MNRRRRIAIYGGTFDPVHLGHLEVARKVCELFEIDQLQFVPAMMAPHKLTAEVTAAIHRYAMLVLATQDDPRLYVSTFEIEAEDRRYTVDTLSNFKARFGEDVDLFFVMGADSWSEIRTWRQWEQLLEMVNHIVVTRPGSNIDLDIVPPELRTHISDLRGSTRQSKLFSESEGTKVFITDAVQFDVSATEIRRAVREEKLDQLEKLVPFPVAQYIKKNQLYKESNET
ncbi:MAG TPA: nicotinate-nucleotide adenylyltransferase [Pyrinomonadaceae bacterium]|nr:nicotinate-nucleotide adenylyltransferase [Pyrinomonadaceae bacterium]